MKEKTMTILNIFNLILDLLKRIMANDLGLTFFYFGVLYFTLFILKAFTHGNS